MQTIEDVLKARQGKRLPGQIFSSERCSMKGGLVRDRPTLASETFMDRTAMSITATISTPDEDRSDDIVEPTGILLERYTLNPVVFFDHGEEYTLPIAKSVDGSGRLSIVADNDEVIATAFFSQSLPLARQVFELWDEKILSATSINFIPKAATVRPGTGRRDRPGMHVTSWELLEWSIVGVPDNPYAVAKALDRGKLDGRAIEEPLLAMLKRFAPKTRAYGKGIAYTGTGGVRPPHPDDAGPESDPKSDDSDSHSVEDSYLPGGHRALIEIEGMAKRLSKKIDRAAIEVDHPKVKAFLEAASPTAKSFCDLVSKCRSTIYKDDDSDELTKSVADVTKQFTTIYGALVAAIKSKLA